MEVKIDLYDFLTVLFLDRTQKIKAKKVISKVFFDTRNPFKYSNDLARLGQEDDNPDTHTDKI